MATALINVYGNLESKSLAALLDKLGKFPGPYPIDILRESQVVGEFLEAKAIQPATPETLLKGNATVVATFKAAAAKNAGNVQTLQRASDNFSIRGGLKAVHLHYNENIYLLTPEQAKEFSKLILTRSMERLSKVRQITFDDALALGSVGQKVAAK